VRVILYVTAQNETRLTIINVDTKYKGHLNSFSSFGGEMYERTGRLMGIYDLAIMSSFHVSFVEKSITKAMEMNVKIHVLSTFRPHRRRNSIEMQNTRYRLKLKFIVLAEKGSLRILTVSVLW
jgi:hypothetical protein